MPACSHDSMKTCRKQAVASSHHDAGFRCRPERLILEPFWTGGFPDFAKTCVSDSWLTKRRKPPSESKWAIFNPAQKTPSRGYDEPPLIAAPRQPARLGFSSGRRQNRSPMRTMRTKKTTASGIPIGKSRWRSNHDVGRLEIRLATRRTHAMPTSCGHGSRKDWGLAGSHACGQAAGNANRKPCPHCPHVVNHRRQPMVACLPRRSARPSFVMTHAVIIRMAITSSSQRAPVNGKFAKTTFRTP